MLSYLRLPFACLSLQQSPLSQFEGHTIKSRVGLTPILRAGLGMTDAMVRRKHLNGL